DVFDKRVLVLDTQEGSAYGAALLAMVGTRHFASVEEACRAVIHDAEAVEPDAGAAAKYRAWHRTYQSLYALLRPFYAEVAAGG
ncbi:MAG: hypothetical protein JO022_10760, partial [Acidobacteriaceae bacterium]|nr:hypothetical protein [Acidobacteriaceae bacterium]